MASLSYDEVFELFLGNITDPVLANMDTNTAYEYLSEYLHKAVAPSYVRRLFSSIKLDDQVQLITYEMAKKTDDDADKDFVKTMLGKAMAVQWLSPQINSKINIAQMFTGPDRKFYSQSNHIAEIRGIKEDMEKELQYYILTRGYISNKYLEGK